ncbi:MAG: hypothetical protein JRD89_18940, partial [Deltaproteobacteria bacterium]|nr:hypothetical protein [Deltaproteobacteria bacterium]
MAKQVSLSDDVIRELDKLKKGRSYSVVIKELLKNQPHSDLEYINRGVYKFKRVIDSTIGTEMNEAIELLRLILTRCYRYRTDEELLAKQIDVLTSSLRGAFEEIYRLSDQE